MTRLSFRDRRGKAVTLDELMRDLPPSQFIEKEGGKQILTPNKQWFDSGPVDVRDIANKMNVCTTTVRRHIERGNIDAVKIGARWAVSQEKANEFLNKYMTGAL